MALFDLSLDKLRAYRSKSTEPEDFDAFWSGTLEEARRQTQHQLDLIDRQIIRRMTAVMPQLQPRRNVYRRGRPPEPGSPCGGSRSRPRASGR